MSNVLPPPPVPPQWQFTGPSRPNQPSRWLAIASLALALVATGVAIGAWFRPLPSHPAPAASTYSSQQVAEAKGKVCAAFSKVHKTIQVTAARDKGSDYASQLASAVNARQALIAGSQYLLITLNDERATPSDLKKEILDLTNAYQLLTVGLLADAPDSEVNAAVHSGDEATSALENSCI